MGLKAGLLFCKSNTMNFKSPIHRQVSSYNSFHYNWLHNAFLSTTLSKPLPCLHQFTVFTFWVRTTSNLKDNDVHVNLMQKRKKRNIRLGNICPWFKCDVFMLIKRYRRLIMVNIYKVPYAKKCCIFCCDMLFPLR